MYILCVCYDNNNSVLYDCSRYSAIRLQYTLIVIFGDPRRLQSTFSGPLATMSEPSVTLASHGQTDDSPSQPVPATASVAAVSVKIPPFWPADPLVWFEQVEAQFSTRNITSERTRFDHVIAALSHEFATEIRDIILRPPQENVYSTLKDLLIKRTAASERKRLKLLFNSEELGDRKPTQLLRRMQQLIGDSAGPDPDNSLLRELFLQRLPGHVRMVLASSGDDVPLTTLADMADKMMEVAHPSVSTITKPAPPPPTPSPLITASEVAQLRSELTELKQLIASLQLSSNRPSRSTFCPHSRSSSRASSPSPSSTNLCWYHRRFADKAKKCTSPCSWQGNEQA